MGAGQAGDRTPHDGVFLQGVQRGGHNRQWNFFAPVTVNMFGPGLERLRDVCFDPAPLARDLDLARFTGREWLISQIDRFICDKPRGYVIVQAEAGVGKSTLAAYLVGSRPWLHHFTRLPGGRSPEAARKSLGAQLIARWDLGEVWAPAGTLPAAAGRPDWFGRLLEDAAHRRDEAEPGTPVVLVIDGLDEAEPDLGFGRPGLPFGLPPSLPDGVFVVATSRFGIDRSLHAVRRPADWLEIAVDGPDNLDDMHRFLLDLTDPGRGDPRLTAALRRDGVDAGWFRAAVADACGGVWIYLRYVLEEIRDGDASARDVTRLPEDLAGYYGEQVRLWQGAPDDTVGAAQWEQVRLPLLGALAAARAPVSTAELAAFTGVPVSAARAFAEEAARAFLSRNFTSSGEPCYALRHQSLRDFLSGEVPAGRPDLASLVPVLAARTTLAHQQITAALTPPGVPGRRDWRTSSVYARSHLAAHSASCGELDSLMSDPGFLLAAAPAGILAHRGTLRTRAGRRALAAFDLTLGEWGAAVGSEGRLARLALNAARVRATELAASCADYSDSEWPVLWAAWTGHGHQTLDAHEGGVQTVAIGQAGGRDVIVSGGRDRTVRCWDAVSGSQLGSALAGHNDAVTSVAAGRAGGRDVIVSGSLDGTVRVWDAVTHEPVGEPLPGHGGRVGAVALGRVGNREVIVGGCAEGWVKVWDAATGSPVTVLLTGVNDLVESLAIGRVNERDLIAAGSADGTVRAWDAAGSSDDCSAFQLADEDSYTAPVLALGRAGGRDVIICGSSGGTIQAWNPAAGHSARPRPLVSLDGYETLTSIAAGRAGNQDLIVCGYRRLLDEEFDLESGYVAGAVETWNAVTGAHVGTLLDGDCRPVTSVAIGHVSGRDIVVAGSSDGTLRIWDAVPVDQATSRLFGHKDSVYAVAVGAFSDGDEERSIVASAAHDGTVHIWDAVTGGESFDPVHRHGTPATSLAVGTVGSHVLVVSGSTDGELLAYDVRRSAGVLSTYLWPALSLNQVQAVAGVAIGRVGRRDAIISATDHGYVQAWHPPFNSPAMTVMAVSHRVTCVAAGQAGDQDIIVTGSDNGMVHAWNAVTCDEASFSPLRHGDSSVTAVTVGRAGDRDVIVSCSDDGTVQAWDAVTAAPVLRLPAAPRSPDGSLRNALSSVAIGRAGSRDVIVTGCEDGAVRIWDAVTGIIACPPLACHDYWVSGVAIGPAGNRTVIASCSDDRSVVVHEYRHRS